jgi:hypothetical protein
LDGHFPLAQPADCVSNPGLSIINQSDLIILTQGWESAFVLAPQREDRLRKVSAMGENA